MGKPFWKQGGVAKMLKAPRQTLKKTLRAVRDLKPESDTFSRDFADNLIRWEKGLEVLDWGFPIREGHSHIDMLALSPARELVFIWVRERCDAAALTKLLPDYDWIQKNSSLWPHLFPQLLENRSLQMMLWIFAREIDPEVRFMLRYLEGIRIRLHLAKPGKERGTWSFSPWSEAQKPPSKGPVLPSAPPVLGGAPPARPKPAAASGPLLSQEEINDLIHLKPVPEAPAKDETTDPHYELPKPYRRSH